MAWTLYRVTWRLESPLHSGFAKLGNIQRTRLYVTGRMLWGALTARLTRDQNGNDYTVVGNAIKECLAFSYGYLCLTEDGDQPLLPEYTAEGLQYKLGAQMPANSLTEREVQRLCLSSYASTALDYANNTAVDGSLHEVEFISPRVLCEEKKLNVKAGQPLYLTALIAEAESAQTNSAVKDWKSSLERLEMGGERTYGFGKLRLRQLSDPISSSALSTAWFGSGFIPDNDQPVIKLQKGAAVTAHTAADHRSISFGQIEPFVGRATTDKAEFGKNVEYSGVYWLPGSILNESADCQICEYGLWTHCA
jgi:hypothetical protein